MPVGKSGHRQQTNTTTSTAFQYTVVSEESQWITSPRGEVSGRRRKGPTT